MSATTGPTGENLRSVRVLEDVPLAANTKIWQGAEVAFDTAGNMVNVTASTTIKPVGIAPRTFDNTGGAAGAVLGQIDFMKERVLRGYLNDSSPNNVGRGNLGAPVYYLDNQTLTTLATGHVATNGRVLDVTTSTSDFGAYIWLEV